MLRRPPYDFYGPSNTMNTSCDCHPDANNTLDLNRQHELVYHSGKDSTLDKV